MLEYQDYILTEFNIVLLSSIAILIFLIVLLIFEASKIRSKFGMEEEDIEHRLDLLRHLVGAGKAYLFIADKEGAVVDINPDIQSLMGLEPNQLYGKDLGIFTEDTPGSNVESLWQVLRDKKLPFHLQLRGAWKNGEEFMETAEIRPLLAENSIVGFVVSRIGSTDGEGQSAEGSEELEKAYAKEQVIVESIGDGVIVTDAVADIVMMNKAAREILDTQESEIGKSIYEILQLEDENSAMLLPQYHPLAEALEDERRVMSRSYYIVRNDFTRISLAVTASPVIVDDGVVGGVIVFRDITKEKDIDRAKTEFVSLASHQLRTPLTTISWYTELLSGTGSDNLTDEQRNYLDVIYDGNQRMIGLVNALLNVSRLELGTFIIEPEPTKVQDLIMSVLRDVQPSVDEKQHEIAFNSEEEMPEINLDPRLMRMIIQNLLTNAIKYTPEKGKITIDLSRHYPDLILKISDNGFGIPINQQDRIFTKLFRADNVLSKNTEGTGLGLYIVKSVLDRAGGNIWFESEEGKGTTFYVTIPLEGMKAKSGTKTLS